MVFRHWRVDQRPIGHAVFRIRFATEVHGESEITISSGTYLSGDLEVGLKAGDHAHVIIDSAQLIMMQDSLRIGELSGGEGSVLIKDGALHSPVDLYVGGPNSVPGRACKATLTIRGGNLLNRTLLVGSGWSAEARFSIEGSRPSAIHFLDYAYIQAFSDKEGHPGSSTLAFKLDERGVTPITIQSQHDGLRIVKDADCHCRLEITLGMSRRETTSHSSQAIMTSRAHSMIYRKGAKSRPTSMVAHTAGN